MGEAWFLVWELLEGSFWGIIVPTLVWIWRYVIVFFLWLLVGGLAAVPLIVSRACKFYHRFRGHWLMQTVICVAAVLLGWFWLHLWTASAILWAESVLPAGWGDWNPFGVGLIGVVFSYFGFLFWLSFRPVKKTPGGWT